MGLNNQAIHQVTYTCQIVLPFQIRLIDMLAAVRDIVVGKGRGLSIIQAKSAAAIQALQYFRTHGIPE